MPGPAWGEAGPFHHKSDERVTTKVIESMYSITDVNTFGERLRYARMQRALTQQRLAQLSRVSQSAIGNYESGLRTSSRSLLRLAKVLGVNPAWLETGQLPMEPTGPAQLVLRDEVQPDSPPQPADWLFTEEDHARYLALDAHDRQFLRQAVRSLMQTLQAERQQAAAAKPAAKRRKR
ncbi:helix-turn-helix transcriptional regulator [Orrella sp. JC864]|uniref:helix-turn-helix domain-containing protein n=1 Tax=Orrella sp. JC864 TaxID=3120298 RepID=UPI00300AB761